jgi:S-(hydroxymethyl)glutathione dehydrogenase/alcohol dehydrogenase
MQVRAAITEGDGSYTIDTFKFDEPQAGEVLVEIKASGVCHTDFDSLTWKKRLVLGHEGAGVVLAAGEGVTGLAPGTRVMLNWAIPCGHCFQCQRGAENICEQRGAVPDARFLSSKGALNASFGLGTMATHAMVPMAAVVPIPDAIPFPVAAILGCGVMTGFGSAVNAARVAEGSSAVVLGCGGVGLSVIQGARYCGAAKIIAVDVNTTRLEMAKRFGATDTIVADRADKGLLQAAKQVRELTDGRGADFAFECTAIPELGPAPLAMVRNGGTAVGVSGIEQTVPVNMELFEWDKLYINPLYGQCRPTRDFPLLFDLYCSGRILLDEMVTRTYSLDELPQAFADMHAGINAKGVIVF